jgi:putative ABC transport system permease protein
MFKFLVQGLFRDRHRYLFPLLIVASGVLIMVFVMALMQGYMESFIRQNAGFDTGHMKVVTRTYRDHITQRPYDLGLLDIKDDLGQWRQRYPQFDWMERIHFGALLDVPDSTGNTRVQGEVAGFGIDLLTSPKERKLMNLDKALARGKMPSKPGDILISDKAFQRLALKLGDPVTLIGADVNGSLALGGFRICGTIDFGAEALDRGAVIADLADVRRMLAMENGAGEVLVFFKDGIYDGKAAKAVRDEFNRLYSNPGDEYSPVMLDLGDQNDLGFILALMDNVWGMISMAFIFILGIVLWNSGLLNGIRRYGEFGVRLAVGESKRHIYRSLILEALAIGIVGSLIGVVLGLAANWYFNIHGMDVSAFSRNSTLMTEDIIYTYVRPGDVVLSLITGVIATVVGAALAGMAIYKRQTSKLFVELEQ